MSRRTLVTIAVCAALAIGTGFLVPKALASRYDPAVWHEPQSVAEQPAEETPAGTGGQAPPLTLVSVSFTGEFLGWAMRDKQTGVTIGENLEQTSSTESMIKTWLVADFLRTEDKPTSYELDQAEEAIRWSDDDAAQVLYEKNGGDASIERMIEMCELTDTTVYPDWWSRTQMSPRDAVRLGECIANGTAAGPQWTDWLVNEMRNVAGTTAAADQEEKRGGGRWGIIDGVPAASADQVAIKNGWTSIGSDGNWHLNCLAFTDEWTMAVMMRYPDELGLDYGAQICESIASQLLT